MRFKARDWGAPWTFRQITKGGHWTIEDATRTVIDGVNTHSEARIVAAAPEALQSLLELYQIALIRGLEGPEMDRAFSVLKKAVPE